MHSGKAARRLILGTLLSTAAAMLLFTADGLGAGAVKTPKVGPPSVTTGGVSHVQVTSATLLGAVNPRGFATTYYFQYGATITYGKQTTPATLPAGSAKIKVGQIAAGALAGYHYRLVATSSAGTKLGKDRTLSTTKSRKAKFSIDKPKEATVYGGSATISGLIIGTGNGGRKLVLQESPYPFLTAFAPIGETIVTNTAGAFSFHVARLTKSTQYRVSTLDPRPLYSSVLTLDAAYKVTLKVKTSSHKGLVRLYGTVTPAVVGARVSFQLRKAVRPGKSEKASERTSKYVSQFETKTKRGTQTVSRFSTVVTVAKGGTYRARVEPLKKGAFVAGQSTSLLLHSAPAKKR
ncbi:MAG TPA: hypothetical protein VHW67_04230 [Solirubrobacteraceae bacterium]|nr:hypothetical protein [Solirubrobacteraceae bacterium]